MPKKVEFELRDLELLLELSRGGSDIGLSNLNSLLDFLDLSITETKVDAINYLILWSNTISSGYAELFDADLIRKFAMFSTIYSDFSFIRNIHMKCSNPIMIGESEGYAASEKKLKSRRMNYWNRYFGDRENFQYPDLLRLVENNYDQLLKMNSALVNRIIKTRMNIEIYTRIKSKLVQQIDLLEESQYLLKNKIGILSKNKHIGTGYIYEFVYDDIAKQSLAVSEVCEHINSVGYDVILKLINHSIEIDGKLLKQLSLTDYLGSVRNTLVEQERVFWENYIAQTPNQFDLLFNVSVALSYLNLDQIKIVAEDFMDDYMSIARIRSTIAREKKVQVELAKQVKSQSDDCDCIDYSSRSKRWRGSNYSDNTGLGLGMLGLLFFGFGCD